MKHPLVLAALLLAAACSPQIYTLHLDVRQPSPSGLDLAGKSIAVVYMDSAFPADSLLDHTLASSLGGELGRDYFGNPDAVSLFHIPQADSVSLTLMRSLVMDTGEDVVFLLDSHLDEPVTESNRENPGAHGVDSAFVCSFQIPLNTALYLYDSMGEDQLRRFGGSSVLRTAVFNNGIVPEENLKDLALTQAAGESDPMGLRIASRFVSNWKTEGFSFYYFEDYNSDRWEEGLEKLAGGQFAAAVDTWASFLKGNSAIQKACAAYNIGMAFYMMGDMEMATRWLDSAEKWENVTLASGLRKRIAKRLEK